MKTKYSLLAAFIVVVSLFISNNETESQTKTENKNMSHSTYKNTSAEKLRTDMRKLWEDHIVWTRNVILCLADDLPGTNQSVDRLLKNQVDIGNTIKSFYGDEAGEKLTALLKSHITIAAEVVTSAKKGDKTSLDEANKRWYANADEIAAFLSSANPGWKLNDLKSMMNEHLKLTTDEAVARIQKNYDADIAAYDKVHEEILMMADDLSNGIIRQFPDKFKE